jgi:predicted DNA-binding ArsR family transcriptional regulator
MNRIKVVNEPSDLVPMLLAVQTSIKRKVLDALFRDWLTMKDVEKKFSKKGKEALVSFEKMKLVETRWQSTEPGASPEKAYHTYYTSFHINASCPVNEMCDILSAVIMPDRDFQKLENKMLRFVGKDGKFAGDVAEKMGLTPTLLKSAVKRSTRLEYRGHRIEKI